MTTVRRLGIGSGILWRSAVDRLVPSEDREGELLCEDQAERSLADDRCYLLIAESEGFVVGLLSAFRFPDVECGGAIVYLYDIEVLKSRRREGIGKQLIESLLHHCDEDDVDLIWAGTEAKNVSARTLFESTGGKLDSDSYTEYEWELE